MAPPATLSQRFVLFIQRRFLLFSNGSQTRRKRAALLVVATLVLSIIVFCWLPWTSSSSTPMINLSGGYWGKLIDNSARTIYFWRQQRAVDQGFLERFGYRVPSLDEPANEIGVPVLTQSYYRHAMEQAASIGLQDNMTLCLPLLHPVVGDWYRPLHWTWTRVISFDPSSMDDLVLEHCYGIWELYQSLDQLDRVQLWALCAMEQFGGIFVSPDEGSLTQLASILTSPSDCSFEELRVQLSNDHLDLLMSRKAHHSAIRCLLLELEQLVASHKTLGSMAGVWQRLQTTKWRDDCISQGHDDAMVVLTSQPVEKDLVDPHEEPPRWSVQVREAKGIREPQARSKHRWSERLQELGCSPGFWCQRCLRSPTFGGSFARCRWICPSCYAEVLCQPDKRYPQQSVVLEARVQERRSTLQKRIPRIVHQTWFEELTTVDYPHLQRLQNSWKSSGWEYRFYTDNGARAFIVEHFPGRVVDAYDAVFVPAFKADFFRLSVLAIHGGVYADIDVQLDVHLDYFVTQNLSFFVPRDVNVDFWPNANYCMWNGLIGASPGHLVVLQALQSLINRALNQQDYLDIEADQCRRNQSFDVWKLRCSPMLLLTGPCALGLAMSEALGRKDPVHGWEIGWQSTAELSSRYEYDWGDLLVLLLDRYDMGETRFTDVGRNLLVASTMQDRIVTRSLKEQTKPVDKAPHYSKFESDIVGTRAYKDDKVYDEQVRFEIVHSYV